MILVSQFFVNCKILYWIYKFTLYAKLENTLEIEKGWPSPMLRFAVSDSVEEVEASARQALPSGGGSENRHDKWTCREWHVKLGFH